MLKKVLFLPNLSLEHLEKANHFLKAAKNEIESNFFDISISNSYYCMLHSAKSLLLLSNESPKTHKGVILLLRQKSEELGIENSVARTMSKLLDQRLEIDYEVGIQMPSEAAAKQAVKDAEEFLKKSKKIIKEKQK